MPGLAELAAVMMQGAARRIDATAANVSNMATPGYQSRRVFSQIVDVRSGLPAFPQAFSRTAQPGSLKATGNKLDFAADAGAVLLLRVGQTFVETRSVQLKRMTDGRLVDAQGRILQAAGGGDLMISSSAPEVLPDGTMLVNGQAEARIAVYEASTDSSGNTSTNDVSSLQELPAAAQAHAVRQGMLVPANVDVAAEMIELNRASRMAETGAKVMQLYDDLVGKAATQLGDVRK